MRGAIPSLPQYAFMAWCSVKAQGHLYLYIYTLKLQGYSSPRCGVEVNGQLHATMDSTMGKEPLSTYSTCPWACSQTPWYLKCASVVDIHKNLLLWSYVLTSDITNQSEENGKIITCKTGAHSYAQLFPEHTLILCCECSSEFACPYFAVPENLTGSGRKVDLETNTKNLKTCSRLVAIRDKNV
jgi:hypothetical protein